MIPLCPVEIFFFAALVLSALLMFGCAIGKNDFRKDVQFVPDVANLADGCECDDDSSCSRGRHGLYAFAYLICLSYQVWRDQEENGRETAKEKEQEMCSSSLQNRDFQAPQSHSFQSLSFVD